MCSWIHRQKTGEVTRATNKVNAKEEVSMILFQPIFFNDALNKLQEFFGTMTSPANVFLQCFDVRNASFAEHIQKTAEKFRCHEDICNRILAGWLSPYIQ
ncbi:hypothetical protein Y032_0002g742 [Ancylostoma ceylanicum]|uniref:Uncharacterized protein n=1 Tax=Ancylostoma ceylanicum TaxID=53326 RepID=A0A016W0G5_9BILA|nr:hypothetical protein Y032_0002g742 [Ancylostoma ceylanicum]